MGDRKVGDTETVGVGEKGMGRCLEEQSQHQGEGMEEDPTLGCSRDMLLLPLGD